MCYITWLGCGCQWAGRAGSGKLAQAVPLVGDAETKQGKKEASEGGEITAAECLRANERTEEAAKPREMRGSQNSFYFAAA